jgi:anti-sigma factor RsiW
MFCESYREALSDAVLLGGRVHGETEAHLATCADCREAFAEEQALLRRIDAGLNSLVVWDVPMSLVPGVRAQIDARTESRSAWRTVLAYATAALAIGAVAVSFSLRSKTPQVKLETTIAETSSVVTSQAASSQVEKLLPYQRSSQSRLMVTGRQASPDSRAARNTQPEVLVSADDQLGLERYAASLRTVARRNAAMLEEGNGPKIKSLEIAELDLKRLSIEPLESGESN